MTNNFFKNNYTAVLGSESGPGPDLDRTVDSLGVECDKINMAWISVQKRSIMLSHLYILALKDCDL